MSNVSILLGGLLIKGGPVENEKKGQINNKLPSGNQTWQWQMMENGPLIGDFPIKTSMYRGLSIAKFVYQRVNYAEFFT